MPGDAAAQLEADLGDLRGLPGAGLAGDDHDLVVADRGGDVVAAGGDRQRRGIGDLRDGGAAGGEPGLGGVDRGDQGGERPDAVGGRSHPEGAVEAAAQALRVVQPERGDALADGGHVDGGGGAAGGVDSGAARGGAVGGRAARGGRVAGGGNAGRGLARGVLTCAPPAAAAPRGRRGRSVDRGGGPGAAVVVRARAGGGGGHR